MLRLTKRSHDVKYVKVYSSALFIAHLVHSHEKNLCVGGSSFLELFVLEVLPQLEDELIAVIELLFELIQPYLPAFLARFLL